MLAIIGLFLAGFVVAFGTQIIDFLADLIYGPTEGVAVILVLGDVGRSPRILRQAVSLADSISKKQAPPHLTRVELYGYQHTSVPSAILNHPNLQIKRLGFLSQSFDATPDLKFNTKQVSPLLGRIIRAIYTVMLTWFLLAKIRHLKLILVQNPPSTPLLLLSFLATCKGCSLIVDCHNYGFSVLENSLKNGSKSIIKNNLVVKVLQKAEVFGLRRANAVFTVSRAMKEDLSRSYNVSADVVYDRPLKFLKGSKIQTLESLKTRKDVPTELIDWLSHDGLTVMMPTSYTQDEDLDMLIGALEIVKRKPRNPGLRILVTGHGDGRQNFERDVTAAGFSEGAIEVRTAFLPSESYYEILSLADLGLCIHKSTSSKSIKITAMMDLEVDLPMKIVDFISVGKPVMAYDYPALDEFGKDLSRFSTAEELAGLFQEADPPPMTSYEQITWKQEWESRVLPCLHHLFDHNPI